MSRTSLTTYCLPALSLGLAVILSIGTAWADPLPGRDQLKFSQRPLDGLTIPNDDGTVLGVYWGHDELSTAYNTSDPTLPPAYTGSFMADDFADRFDSPVVHVKWWGSYMGQTPTTNPIDQFLIAFESDMPLDPAINSSRPDQVLSSQIVTRGPLSPGSGTFTEKQISPGGAPLNEALYEYNAELHLGQEFFQQPDTVYWLKIVALYDIKPGEDSQTIPRWGWHDRDYTINDPLASIAPAVSPGEYIEGMTGTAANPVPVWHFQDDAVSGQVVIEFPSPDTGPWVFQDSYQPMRYLDDIDGPPGISQYSKDLAFELYTVQVPEPASIGMACLGLAVVGIGLRRRHRS